MCDVLYFLPLLTLPRVFHLSKTHYQISNLDNSHLKEFHLLNNNYLKHIQLSSLTRDLFNKQDV